MSYQVGSSVRLKCSFTEVESGEYADPTTVSVTIQNSTGAKTTTTSVTRDSLGSYHYDFLPTVVGSHRVEWQATGAVVAVGSMMFNVSPSIITL